MSEPSTMRFGVSLLGLAQQPAGEDMIRRSEELLTWVRLARDAGYDHLTTGQHYLSTPLKGLQPVPLLARIIPESGTMRLVSTIIGPLHNPVSLAEDWATLDVLSGGRVTLCLALGYRSEEYAAFGVDPSRRVRDLANVIEAVRSLWSGIPVTLTGRGFGLNGATCSLETVQDPHPPIWLAANADAAVQRAARLGLDWNIGAQATVPEIARQTELYHAADPSAGRRGFPLSRELFCAATDERAYELAAPYLLQKYQVRAKWRSDDRDAARPDGSLETLAQDRFIIGAPDTCEREIRRYQELGVDRIHLRMNWPGMPLRMAVDGLERFAAEVLPRFR